MSMDDALFQRALQVVLKHEGGYSDHPADPGGITNYGISLRYLLQAGKLTRDDIDGDGDLDRDDIRRLTVDHAALIYYQDWWDRYGYHRLPDDVAVKVMDMAVNMGAKQAHKLLQRAVNTLRRPDDPLVVDGVIGPKTITAACLPDPGDLLTALRLQQRQFYLDLIARKPELQVFWRGWKARAAS